LIDKDIDDSNRVVRADIVLKTLGEQRDLRALLAFYESPHQQLQLCDVAILL
jgi:hypothetical protein